MPNKITTNDRRALNLALSEILRGLDKGRAQQVEAMIALDGWRPAAEFAAHVLQTQALGLRPWDTPPCLAEPNDGSPAGKLLAKMLARNLSRFDIDPLRVLEERLVG